MSFFKKFAAAFILTVVLFGGGQSHIPYFTPALSANGESTSSNNVFELVINQVKPEQLSQFNSTREAFISQLETQEGFENGATFKSFFSTTNELTSEVFVRLTEWDSIEAYEEANKNLMSSQAFESYSRTFNELANVQIEPEDGKEFEIDNIINDGQVVEFAVRTVKPEFLEVFPEKRAAFFDLGEEQKGYVLDRELLALEGDERVLIVAWDSPEDFQNGFQNLSQGPEMMDFLSTLDVQTYHATQKVE